MRTYLSMTRTFTVTTTEKTHRFPIAIDYTLHFNKTGPTILEVVGDDDFEDGPIQLRCFMTDNVLDYGWEQ